MPSSPSLRVAVLAHLRHPIAEPFRGGMEAHTALLTDALVEAGHRPMLFATADSAPGRPLEPVSPEGYERILPWARWHGTPQLGAWLTDAYDGAWRHIRAGAFDVVHNNTVFAPLPHWAVRDRVATVTTLHVPPFAALSDAIGAAAAPWHRTTVPSRDQQRIWQAATGFTPTVVPNGIALDRWPFDPAGGGRAIWFGRITGTKGTAEALRAASLASIGLDVAGPIEDANYFEGLRPLWGDDHRYLGHLHGPALAAAVGRAAVALCTPRWDEPFGLVAAEALACGTPVAAFARGALADVIGNAGALADDVAGLAQAIGRARRVSRPYCRVRAERLFGASAMVERYLAIYRDVIAAASSIANTRAELA
ncbi:MAG: glycosyltransferase [Sphingomonas taxi]